MSAMPRRSRSPNLTRVAQEAGVSVATVSIILNTPEKADRFSDECKSRVRAVAQKMGYQRNIHASRFRSRKAQAIGLVMEILDNEYVLAQPYWARLLSGLDHAARMRGYEIVIVGPHEGRTAAENAIVQYHQHRLDGLVIPARITANAKRCLRDFPGPVIVINRSERNRLSTVYEDDAVGIRAAMDHLAEQGHKKIAWLGPQSWPGGAASWRHAIYRKITAERKQRAVLCTIRQDKAAVRNAERLTALVERMCEPLLLRRSGPSAILCFNDDFALGVYRAALRLGIRIPDELSVVGYDDASALYFTPPLTTVRSSILEVGKKTAHTMIDWIEGDTPYPRKPTPITVAPTLIVRESTARYSRT